VTLSTYLEIHYGLLSLLLNPGDLRRVMACNGRWAEVKACLARLTASHTVGRAMFGWTKAALEMEAYENLVRQGIEKLFGSTKLTVAQFQNFRRRCEEELAAWDLKEASWKKQIEVPFLGGTIQVPITTSGAYWRVMLAAATKTWALSNGQLSLHDYERWVLSDDFLDEGKAKVPEQEVAPFLARTPRTRSSSPTWVARSRPWSAPSRTSCCRRCPPRRTPGSPSPRLWSECKGCRRVP
jgi:hypothetical protein